MIYGFSFNGIHLSSMDVYFKTIDRPVLPATRRKTYIIPGRSGDLEFGQKEYQNRPIKLRIIVLNKSLTELRVKIRSLAEWLSKEGRLIFDDEPGKSYTARIDDLISLEQIGTAGEFDLTFICKPFAESLNYNQTTEIFNHTPHTTSVNSAGNASADCVIIIKNKGTTNINTIKLTRKAEV